MRPLFVFMLPYFFFSGCYNAYSTPKKAAVAMCEAARTMDLVGMNRMASPALHTHITQQYELFLALEDTLKEVLLHRLADAPSCEADSAVRHSDATVTVTLKNMGTYTLKNLGGKWKVVRF